MVKASDLIELTVEAEASGAFDAVWAGDSLLAKPRLESVTLLSALAGATKRVRLGVGCMATFVHRHPVMLAHEWASLDVISGGRSWLAVCLGGPDEMSVAQALEHRVMGIQASERVARLEEGIVILRKLFHEKSASHAGRSISSTMSRCSPAGPAAVPDLDREQPHRRTWKGGASASGRGRRARPAPRGPLRRRLDDQQAQPRRVHAPVGAHRGDGARGRARSAQLGSALYHNIHVDETSARARGDKKFLDTYYTSNFSAASWRRRTVAGGPRSA